MAAAVALTTTSLASFASLTSLNALASLGASFAADAALAASLAAGVLPAAHPEWADMRVRQPREPDEQGRVRDGHRADRLVQQRFGLGSVGPVLPDGLLRAVLLGVVRLWSVLKHCDVQRRRRPRPRGSCRHAHL